MGTLTDTLLEGRYLPKHLSKWAEAGIEIDHCPECNRTHGQRHLRSSPRRAGFVRSDGKRCLLCKAPANTQHRKYQGEPCPNWF